jgi:hypothetical protein
MMYTYLGSLVHQFNRSFVVHVLDVPCHFRRILVNARLSRACFDLAGKDTADTVLSTPATRTFHSDRLSESQVRIREIRSIDRRA